MTLDLKDRLYTSSEVAEILGVSLRSVYRYLEEGKLDADIKTATGRHRFSKKNILDFLQPGGITKDQAEDQFISSSNNSLEDEFDVLDLPAINKTKKSEESYDDFSFDLDEDFFKSLDFDSKPNQSDTVEQKVTDNNPKISNGDYIDDDLEKLLKEFEEKEGLSSNLDDFSFDSSSNKPKNNSHSNTFEEDELDFDLDSFFKELEEESDTNKSLTDNTKPSVETSVKNSSNDDFDFDFDLDFLNELTEEKAPQNKQEEVKPVISKNSFDDSLEEESEDNWLERFRKAAQKNSNTNVSNTTNDTLKDSFFDSSSIDHFFDNAVNNISSTPISSLSNSEPEDLNIKSEKLKGNREYYYSSSLNGLKEIAQNIDKIAKKFDTDYAFTMNAGLSLHKPISPFTLIHSYVRGRDLELFEDYLNLTEVDNPSEASVCLIVPGDLSVFEDSYELHGLCVVSNVQLRSDLIDKGLDKLAREI